MSIKATMVDKVFPGNRNCAQTVLSLHANNLGIDENIALKIASGFGGGMACAETCGAVTGAYMVIGIKHGHVAGANPDEKAQTKQKIQVFNKEFEKAHGSLICKKLTGFDISKTEELNKAKAANVFSNECPKFIKTACNILEEKI